MLFFEAAPDELVLNIFNHLSALQDKKSSALVNKQFYRISTDKDSNLVKTKRENLEKMPGYPFGNYRLFLQNVRAPGTPHDYTLSLMEQSEQKVKIYLFKSQVTNLLKAAGEGRDSLIQALGLLNETKNIASLLEKNKAAESQMSTKVGLK